MLERAATEQRLVDLADREGALGAHTVSQGMEILRNPLCRGPSQRARIVHIVTLYPEISQENVGLLAITFGTKTRGGLPTERPAL